MFASHHSSMSRAARAGRRFQAADNGTIAVEFGLVAPVVLVLLLGVVESSLAISDNLSVQAAARAGTHFGLTKPPLQGDMSSVIASARAAMPTDWAVPNGTNSAVVIASLKCECEITGPAVCGMPCGLGEASQTYLRVEVSKTYKPLLSSRYFSPSFQFKNASLVRLK